KKRLLNLLQTTSPINGAKLALWIWIGFVATVTLSSVLWENKSYKLYLLNNGYNVVNMVVMAVILTLWQ
ncbi:MAG: DUF1761 domain-containing protein, partial [Nanoarchaeota archaeon]